MKAQALRVQTFKIIARWYMTPKIIAHSAKRNSSLCWRDCGQVGTYSHCWIGCPKFAIFWISVIKAIHEITGFRLQQTICHLLLGHYERQVESGVICSTIAILLVAAKAMIAIRWKNDKPPTMEMWRSKLWDIFVLEKLSLNISSYAFPKTVYEQQKIWAPIIKYLDGHGDVPGELWRKYL